MNAEQKGSDTCACGDYRSQHENNGRCLVCGGLSGPYNGCTQFRLHAPANAEQLAHWEKYHGDAWRRIQQRNNKKKEE